MNKVLDLMALKCFLAVAQTGSFTKAAKKINRTQSAISQQISKLENQLEQELFKRDRDFRLTSHGESLLKYASQMMNINNEIIDRFSQPNIYGEINFGVVEDFATMFLSDILSDFSKTHPRVNLNVECDLTLNLFEKFKDKKYDLVLLKMSKPDEFSNLNVKSFDILQEELVWVASHDFDLELFLQNHEEIPLILSPKPCVYRSRTISALEKINQKWRITFSSDSYLGKISATKAQMGITVLPRNLVPQDLKILRLKALPNLDNTHISLLKYKSQNDAVSSFREFILERLKLC